MLCAVGLSACGENNSEKTECTSSSSSSSSVIQAIAVESVTLDKTAITLEIGGEETLTATVTPDNATDKAVAWSSDNTAVATVADGKVTAVSAGTATVTAAADGKSATCSVTVNAPAPITEVTAEQWAKIMVSADNFTFINSLGEQSMTAKIDGTTRSQGRDGMEQIFVVEGDKYFSYDNFDGKWKKSSITEEVYGQSESVAQTVAFFRDDFASFDYVEGKYVATALDKMDTMNGVLNNVEIAFENGTLVSIKFSVTYGVSVYNCEIINVGTTEITLPEDYTDLTVGV